MQSRGGGLASTVDEVGAVEKGKNGRSSIREWPTKLSKIFCLFLTLGVGVLLGIVASLHLMGYFRDGMMSSLIMAGAPSTHQQHVHLHVIAANDWQSFHHNMGDEELLWRASMVPHRPGLPVRRTPKVAFMFLTVGAIPLAPLWEKFFKGHQDLFNIYIHSLPDYEPSEQPTSVFFGRHVLSRETKWGDISMCDAERRLLANALLDQDNERFVLISESCAPLWNFTFTYNYLLNSKESFIGVFDDPGPHGRGRYDQRMLPEVPLEQWRKGAQWFEVERKLAIYIISDLKYYDKFHKFCQPPCYVDEHYIPTMMYIEFKDKIAGRSVTAVDWSKGGSHPGIFGKDDAEAFYQATRENEGCIYNGEPGQVCYLFARKFAPNSLQPLLHRSSFFRKLK